MLIELNGIESRQLNVFRSLTDVDNRAKTEAESGILIAESINVVEAALSSGCEPVAFLMERRFITGKAAALLSKLEGYPVYTGNDDILTELLGYRLNRGIIGAFKRPASKTVTEICEGAHRIAVLEGIGDAANIGAIFRSAAALGADGILLTPNCADPFYRKAVRVSMGTVFRIPWLMLGNGTTGADIASILRKNGFSTVALALDNRAADISALSARNTEKLAIFLGSEGLGLRPETIAACERTAYIPMAPGVDSLNVAAAGAIALWELRYRTGEADGREL